MKLIHKCSSHLRNSCKFGMETVDIPNDVVTFLVGVYNLQSVITHFLSTKLNFKAYIAMLICMHTKHCSST